MFRIFYTFQSFLCSIFLPTLRDVSTGFFFVCFEESEVIEFLMHRSHSYRHFPPFEKFIREIEIFVFFNFSSRKETFKFVKNPLEILKLSITSNGKRSRKLSTVEKKKKRGNAATRIRINPPATNSLKKIEEHAPSLFRQSYALKSPNV